MKAKSNCYTKTTWLFDKKKRSFILDYLHDNWKNSVYLYEKHNRDMRNGFYTPSMNNVCRLSCSTKEIDANLTVIVDMMYKVGYKTVYFLGVDLSSSGYFWTGVKRYFGVNIPDSMDVDISGSSKSNMHSTQNTAKFLEEFSEHNNINYINLACDSLLSRHMPYMGIREFVVS